jgi:peptidoglycan/xylan/chitin deacetylase (PgdA/CDA1 family)
MRLVTPLLKHAVYPTLHRIGWLDRMMPPGGYAVANYHGVVPPDHTDPDTFLDGNLVHPEVLRQQLQFLKAHYHVIHPEEFRARIDQGKALPSRSVLVTCDDGLLNVLTDMLPVLQSEGVCCLFFVTGTSCGENPGMLWYEELYRLMRIKPLGELESLLPLEKGSKSQPAETFQSLWWNAVRRASRLGATARARWMDRVRSHRDSTQVFQSERRWRLLGIAELKQLAQAGMSIGAHTLTHPILSLCSEDEARREISASKHAIKEALGQNVWAFAYPFGNPATMGGREVRLAREAGFSCGFLNVEHWRVDHGVAESSDAFTLPRTHVSQDTGLPELAAHLSGLHTRLQRAIGG